MDEIGERIIAVISKHLDLASDKIHDSSSIRDLGADSLDTIELIMKFEDEFGCEIPDEDAEALITIGDVKTYLENKMRR
jgi:acyl carrier protein